MLAIALQRCLTHEVYPDNPRKYLYRPIRLAVLARLFERDLTYFNSSKQLFTMEVARLLELLYGLRWVSLDDALHTALDPLTVSGIQFAAQGLFERYYDSAGKFVHEEAQDA